MAEEAAKEEKRRPGGHRWGSRPAPGSIQAPSNPLPVKWRLADLDGLLPGQVAELKGLFLVEVRRTAKLHVSAERVGCTWPLVQRILEGDPVFREETEHAVQARVDEIELDLEGSTNRSGGDVTARIFALKGYRPDRYMERIAQQTWTHQVYDPQMDYEVLDGSEKTDRTPPEVH